MFFLSAGRDRSCPTGGAGLPTRAALPLLWGLLLTAAGGCDSGRIDPGALDGSARADRPPPGVDLQVASDQSPRLDLTAVAGDPCTYGQCAEGLICMANVCHTMCSTSCGAFAPECPPGVGCFRASDFTGACMPGTAELDQECGEGIFCKGGLLCVYASYNRDPRCFLLCDNGSCPLGKRCVEADNGCLYCY